MIRKSQEFRDRMSQIIKALGPKHPMKRPEVAAKVSAKNKGRVPPNKKYWPQDTHRTCYLCQETKLVADFCVRPKGRCLVCERVYRKKLFDGRDKAAYNKRKKRDYWKNPEVGRKAAIKWRRKNLETAHKNAREWHKKNPTKSKLLKQKRYRTSRKAEGTCSTIQWIARVDFYGWRCAYCRKKLTVKTLTQDHLIPLIAGGSHWPSNLVPACVRCNGAKGGKNVQEFLISIARVA